MQSIARKLIAFLIVCGLISVFVMPAMAQEEETEDLVFQIVGEVTFVDGDILVDGIVIAPAGAFNPSGLVSGDTVVVTGYLLNDDTLQAISLEVIVLFEEVTFMGDGQVAVGGAVVATNDDFADITPGTLVIVTYYISANGSIVIVSVVVMDAEATPEATAEATPEATAEATPEATAEATPEATPVVELCGNPNHPIATRISEEFEISYDEVMALHCSGMGFGNIARAYLLAEQTDEDVSVYLEMRASGMGWGQIVREAGVSPSELAPGRVFNGRNRDEDADSDTNTGNGNGNGNGNGGNGNGNGNGGNGNGNGNGGNGNGNGNGGNGNGGNGNGNGGGGGGGGNGNGG